jgi:hypothetical protein
MTICLPKEADGAPKLLNLSDQVKVWDVLKGGHSLAEVGQSCREKK